MGEQNCRVVLEGVLSASLHTHQPRGRMTDSHEVEHTLKNYLAIILGFSEILLQEASPDDPRLDDFREIHKAAQAAVRLVNEKWGQRS
jgi:signal transduction histidine kinase